MAGWNIPILNADEQEDSVRLAQFWIGIKSGHAKAITGAAPIFIAEMSARHMIFTDIRGGVRGRSA